MDCTSESNPRPASRLSTNCSKLGSYQFYRVLVSTLPMTTLYSLGYRSTALPVHSSYTKDRRLLGYEQCARGKDDQRRRRPQNRCAEVLLPTPRLRERRDSPRNGRGRANQSQTKTCQVPPPPSPQAQLAQRSDHSTTRETPLPYLPSLSS